MRAIKWVDEEEPSKTNIEGKKDQKGLVTNKSSEDLVHKVAEDLTPIDVHKDAAKKSSLKSAIKPFQIDVNKLTGLSNFTQLSPDPLALPPYALPPGQ